MATTEQTQDKPVSIQKRRQSATKKPAEVKVKRPGADSLIPFLTLEEVPVETVPIKVFGHTYDMIAPQDMSPLKRHRIDSTWRRMLEIQARVEEGLPSEIDDEAELEVATNEMVIMIVPSMPHDVFIRLNWTQKEAIVEGFLAWKALRDEASKMLVQMKEEASLQTGPR